MLSFPAESQDHGSTALDLDGRCRSLTSLLQRKVKFPLEFDVLSEGMVTDDLRAKLAPVNGRLKEIERERLERKKVRRRTKKVMHNDLENDVPMGDVNQPEGLRPIVEGDLPDEKMEREKEKKELVGLVHPDLLDDEGANATGVYELVGAFDTVPCLIIIVNPFFSHCHSQGCISRWWSLYRLGSKG